MRICGPSEPSRIAPLALDKTSVASTQSAEGQQISDSVTVSSAARQRQSAAAHPRFGALSAAAHQDSELAEQLAYDQAHAIQTPLYDLRGLESGTGPLRYSATGEAVTPETEARHRQRGENLQAASLDLYNKEKAKGTDAADIFDKLIALGDRQPAEFRTIINWEAQIG